MLKRFTALLVLALIAVVGAHAHLGEAPESITPGETFTFTLTEPIELMFSEFRVFAITDEEAETLTADEFLAFLDLNEDEGVQGIEVTEDADAAFRLHITFAEDLAPGTYVLVWNVLSIDTHSSKEHYVFEVVAEH